MGYELTPENVAREFRSDDRGPFLQTQIELLVKQAEERGQMKERKRCLEILGRGARDYKSSDSFDGDVGAWALTQAQKEIGEYPSVEPDKIYVG